MRIHLPKKQFADVLSQVERIVPTRSSTPGLHLVHLYNRDNQQLVFKAAIWILTLKLC